MLRARVRGCRGWTRHASHHAHATRALFVVDLRHRDPRLKTSRGRDDGTFFLLLPFLLGMCLGRRSIRRSKVLFGDAIKWGLLTRRAAIADRDQYYDDGITHHLDHRDI